MKTKTKIISVICPMFALMASGTAMAADATGTLVVEATVANACNVSTSPVGFGEVGLEQASANGTITVNCTVASPFTVALDGGQSGDIDDRELTSAEGNSLKYQLYTSANNTAVWGDGATGDTVDGAGPTQTLTVYGKTLGDPTAAGAYTDSVTVTVTY